MGWAMVANAPHSGGDARWRAILARHPDAPQAGSPILEFPFGVACRDAAPAPAQPLAEACHFGGVTYASGSASCQGGMQYMCDDGAWTGLGTSCPLADSPIRVIPD
jgi:hypothetical protein